MLHVKFESKFRMISTISIGIEHTLYRPFLCMLSWEKDDNVILVGDGWWSYSGVRRIMMWLRWEKDDDVISIGEGW